MVEELDLERVKDKSIIYKSFLGKTQLSTASANIRRLNIETGAGKVILRPSSNRTLTVDAEIFVSAKNKQAAYRTMTIT